MVVLTRDSLVRAGLERLLSEHGLALADQAEANVAVVDLRPGDRCPSLEVPIVALVDAGTRPTEVLGAGASAVMCRDADPDRLCAAILATGYGLVVVDGAMARGALPEPEVEATDGEELSTRERQVIMLVASGLSNKRIADRLGISEHTAKFFVSSILGKLGVSTRTEAVVVAARRGLLWL